MRHYLVVKYKIRNKDGKEPPASDAVREALASKNLSRAGDKYRMDIVSNEHVVEEE